MDNSLWGQDFDIYEGFNDHILKHVFKKNKHCGYIPRLYWTTEVYSFGKAYREWLNLPKCLPLPFYGDHGYSALGELQSHEINSRANIHVTFNKYRYEKIKDSYNKKILYITNPWINWRRKHGMYPSEQRVGTLVFYSHSITDVDIIDYDYEEYFDQLRNLPDKFHPLVFMFHINDIKKGYHKFIQNMGFPYLTAGNQNNSLFIDRFYDIARNFKYATSNTGGSELFYCQELGVDYFILGEEPIFFNKGHRENPLGKLDNVDRLQTKLNKYKRKLFHYRNLHGGKEDKHNFIEDSLGLNSNISKESFKKMVLKEYFKQLPAYVKTLIEKFKTK